MLKIVLLFFVTMSCSKHEETHPDPSPTVVPSPSPTPAPTPSPSPEAPKYHVIKGENGKTYHTGLLHPAGEEAAKRYGKLHVSLNDCDNLPDEFDLRKLGTVPDIRDQGQCGSCWSFSKTGSLESALMASGAKPLDLAEQELVSCDKTQWGCDGGVLSEFSYQIEKGQSLETDFPYISGRTGSNGSCKPGLKPAAKGVNFAYVGEANRSPTEKELMCALYKTHTIPWITVSASNAWGSPPSSEDQVYTRCGRGQTNHAVGVIGWKKINGKLGFIMKNSWGTSWGAKGYMVMPLGCDALGDEAAYIVTDATPCKPPMVKLPTMVITAPGVEVLVGVKDATVEGWTYDWYDEKGTKIASGPHLYVTPMQNASYKLVARNKCGTAESTVFVQVVAAQSK